MQLHSPPAPPRNLVRPTLEAPGALHPHHSPGMHATSPDGGRDAPSLLDISVKTREDDEGGAAAKTTMTTTTTTRQRVEEVVKTLDVAKLQEDWVNAICEKLEGKRA